MAARATTRAGNSAAAPTQAQQQTQQTRQVQQPVYTQPSYQQPAANTQPAANNNQPNYVNSQAAANGRTTTLVVPGATTQTVAASPTSRASSSSVALGALALSSSAVSSADSVSSSDSFPLAAKIGAGVGGGVAVAILALLGICLYRRRRANHLRSVEDDEIGVSRDTWLPGASDDKLASDTPPMSQFDSVAKLQHPDESSARLSTFGAVAPSYHSREPTPSFEPSATARPQSLPRIETQPALASDHQRLSNAQMPRSAISYPSPTDSNRLSAVPSTYEQAMRHQQQQQQPYQSPSRPQSQYDPWRQQQQQQMMGAPIDHPQYERVATPTSADGYRPASALMRAMDHAARRPDSYVDRY